jgi:hypothetical protein
MAVFKIVALTPATAITLWYLLAPQIELVGVKAAGGYTLDEVKEKVALGLATVYVHPDAIASGVLIVNLWQATAGNILRVWIARCDVREWIPPTVEFLKRLARVNDVVRIEFFSPRKGWRRRLPEFSHTDGCYTLGGL